MNDDPRNHYCWCGEWGSRGSGKQWFCGKHTSHLLTQQLPPPPAPALLPVMTLAQMQAELRSGKGDAARRRALWLALDKLVAAQGG